MNRFRSGNGKSLALDSHIKPFEEYQLPPNKGPYTPSSIEIFPFRGALETASGEITWALENQAELNGDIIEYFPNEAEGDTATVGTPDDKIESRIYACYAYLATAKTLSTAVAPSEYGDASASDELLVILYLTDVDREYLQYLKTGNMVKLTVGMYTNTTPYRITTGNAYTDHIELKVTPTKL